MSLPSSTMVGLGEGVGVGSSAAAAIAGRASEMTTARAAISPR